jgi:hypothetical protein
MYVQLGLIGLAEVPETACWRAELVGLRVDFDYFQI